MHIEHVLRRLCGWLIFPCFPPGYGQRGPAATGCSLRAAGVGQDTENDCHVRLAGKVGCVKLHAFTSNTEAWLLRRQASMLMTVRRTSSCCSGAFTAEMGLAVVERTVNECSREVLGLPIEYHPVFAHAP